MRYHSFNLPRSEIIKRINEYAQMQEGIGDIPTIAGLAGALGVSKSVLAEYEFSKNRELKNSFIYARNVIEHRLLSLCAFKKISSSMVNFYLGAEFGYKKPASGGDAVGRENGEVDISLVVKE